MITIYNTKPNDSEKIVINSEEDIEEIENIIKNLEEKKSLGDIHAERQVDGGEDGIRTHAPCYRPNPLAGGPLNHLGTSPFVLNYFFIFTLC